MKFINEMIEHYAPLMTSIKTMAGYKSSGFLGGSLVTAVSLEALAEVLQLDFLGVTVGMLAMVAFFIIADWWTGSAASNMRAMKFREHGDMEGYEENRIKSSKVSFTIFKFISLYLWLVLSHSVYETAVKNSFILIPTEDIHAVGLHTALKIISIVPVMLFGFREFISIGENIKNMYGKTPYLFTLGERIFDMLQFNFLRKLVPSDYKPETIETNKQQDTNMPVDDNILNELKNKQDGI